jgi:hypothetical protein
MNEFCSQGTGSSAGVGSREAAVKATGMYSQRVPKAYAG